jgi:DNA repair protein RecO
MVEHNENSNVLYKLLSEFLNKLIIRDDLKVLLLEFRIKMLYFLGIQPQFKMCCHCGDTNELVGLSITNGAMECINHTSSDNIGLTATKIINLLYNDKTLDIQIEDQSVVDLLSGIIDTYYEKHQYYGLKSKVMLEKLGCY